MNSEEHLIHLLEHSDASAQQRPPAEKLTELTQFVNTYWRCFKTLDTLGEQVQAVSLAAQQIGTH